MVREVRVRVRAMAKECILFFSGLTKCGEQPYLSDVSSLLWIFNKEM